jgi:competence/damage-inducible protein CinA-like protein
MVDVQARIISVGDELLCGRTVDTNSHRLQQWLGRRGVAVIDVQVVADRSRAIAQALERTDAGNLVVITGGLGPTGDDLTVQAISDWAQAPLVVDDAVESHLRARAAERNYPWGPNLIKQTLRPKAVDALINPAGTAPALVGELKGRLLVLLPGVPQEILALWPQVESTLTEKGILAETARFHLRRTVGLSEPELARRTVPLQVAYPDLAWSWWLTRWGVDVQASFNGTPLDDRNYADLGDRLDEALTGHVYTDKFEDLNTVVLDRLRTDGLTIGAAESCTGGMIGASLTDQPGSSAVFKGSIVAYANTAKTALLNVPRQILDDEGAVSSAVAEAMAVGARKALDVDLAVSVTGISGPDGGSDEKPVGTTWIGWADASGVWSRKFRFGAYRERNRELTVAAALAGVWRRLSGIAEG